jgi:hypothetical protein
LPQVLQNGGLPIRNKVAAIKNVNAQVKFQKSMKFQLLNPKIYLGKYNLFPAYLGNNQKSLWNVRQSAIPFEETG